MALKTSYAKKTFHFSFDARTSRGQMKDKSSWFVKIWNEKDPNAVGIGECGPLPGLSADARPDFEEVLITTLDKVKLLAPDALSADIIAKIVPRNFPSITFGIETALLDLKNGGKRMIFDNGFINGQRIPINGLVWMGDFDFMMDQINRKLSEGFTCIKLKIGGIGFETECQLLEHIRKNYSSDKIAIRLDANGAFLSDEALERLNRLAEFGIHSIEQPLKAGSSSMKEICSQSLIPVALDEELIGVYATEEKTKLLQDLQPQFIVLKPTLHGGLSGCREWIALAESLGIGWWITSALESNIGLNAICQFTANYKVNIPQGLGTGMIYQENIPSPLTIANGAIFIDAKGSWIVEDL